MKANVNVEFRCREHEARVDKCEICEFLVRAEKSVEALVAAHDRLIEQVARKPGVVPIRLRSRR